MFSLSYTLYTATHMISRSDPTLDALSPNEQKVMGLAHDVRFGEIADLHICDGDPSFDPKPRVRRLWRLDRDHRVLAPHPMSVHAHLKDRHVHLFQRLRAMPRAIVTIEIADGLPLRLLAEDIRLN